MSKWISDMFYSGSLNEYVDRRRITEACDIMEDVLKNSIKRKEEETCSCVVSVTRFKNSKGEQHMDVRFMCFEDRDMMKEMCLKDNNLCTF